MSASSFLINSCIFLLYISVAAAQPAGPDPPARGRFGEADALYADRANIASALRAADLWRTQDGFEAAWKLARADYWLGGHTPEAERRAFLEQGIAAGRKASSLEPKRPAGYFWMAANMGALAESYGLRQGIKYRGAIKQALETVLRIDPAFQQGSADRALGRWYFKVPRLFGGSHKEAERHLRESLKYNDQSTASRFFLAEVLLDDDRKAEGRAELQKVLDAPIDPEWAPEDRDFREKASRLLNTTQNMYMEHDTMYIGFRDRRPAMASAVATVRHKHLRIDQAKLDKAREVLDAATETEALDRALDIVVSEAEIDATLRQLGGKGRFKKIFR